MLRRLVEVLAVEAHGHTHRREGRPRHTVAIVHQRRRERRISRNAIGFRLGCAAERRGREVMAADARHDAADALLVARQRAHDGRTETAAHAAVGAKAPEPIAIHDHTAALRRAASGVEASDAHIVELEREGVRREARAAIKAHAHLKWAHVRRVVNRPLGHDASHLVFRPADRGHVHVPGVDVWRTGAVAPADVGCGGTLPGDVRLVTLGRYEGETAQRHRRQHGLALPKADDGCRRRRWRRDRRDLCGEVGSGLILRSGLRGWRHVGEASAEDGEQRASSRGPASRFQLRRPTGGEVLNLAHPLKVPRVERERDLRGAELVARGGSWHHAHHVRRALVRGEHLRNDFRRVLATAEAALCCGERSKDVHPGGKDGD